MLKGAFLLRGVVGGPGDGCVFSNGKGGGNADYGHCSGENGITEGGGVEAEGFEVGESGSFIGNGLDFAEG